MRLVYIQSVNAQLLKGNHIVLAACFRELFQPCFQTALGTLHLEHQERMRLQAEYTKATEQARAFRQELESYLDNYFRDCRACFDEALSEIYLAFRSGDAEGVVQGANKLTRKLGGTVPFNNREEFGEYLLSDSVDTF